MCLRTVSDGPCTDAPSLTVRVTGKSASGLWATGSNPTCQRASNGAMGRVLTLPPLRFGLLARARVACGPRASNPTCQRASNGAMDRVLTLPPLRFGLLARAQVACGPRASNPTCQRASNGVMGRVLTLPPLRFGLLARAQVACGPRASNRGINEKRSWGIVSTGPFSSSELKDRRTT